LTGGALVAAAALVAVAALVAGLRARVASGDDPARAGAAAGALLTFAILLADSGHALSWRYGVLAGGGRVELPGVGLLLGLTLLVTLAGTLVVAMPLFTPATPRAPQLLGRRVLLLSAGLGALASGLMVFELLRLGRPAPRGVYEASLVGGATGLLGVALSLMLSDRNLGGGEGREAEARRLTILASLVAATAVVACGVDAWNAAGAYLTPRTGAALSAALLGLAAREGTLVPNLRRGLFFVALVLALAP
jgi:hypothetical protein